MDELRISPSELAEELHTGTPLRILDVRAPERAASGSIDVTSRQELISIRGSQVRASDSLKDLGLSGEVPIVTVCGHGNDSFVVAAHLSSLGARARSLDGGMNAWMRLAVPRRIPPPDGLDRLIQFDRIGKGSLGYVLVSDGQSVIVDPARDVTPYLRAIRDENADLIGVLDTHVHADYISGGPQMAREYGIPYYLHPADAVYPYDGTPGNIPFSPIGDGDVVKVGRETLRVLHTPGHTEGSVTYLLGDSLAFTGDFLFVASLGRPDLAGRTKEWSESLRKSLARSRDGIGEKTLVLPAHYAGHEERNSDWTVCARFGDVAAQNKAFSFRSKAGFLAWVGQKESPFPESYRTIKSVNVGLTEVTPEEADVLEAGKNECALG